MTTYADVARLSDVAAKMIEVEFVDVTTGDFHIEGPFPFVQITYNMVRVDDGNREIAWFVDGLWETSGNKRWTDFIVRPVTPNPRNESLPEAHRIWTLAAGNADEAQRIWLDDDSWTDANSAGQ